MDILSNSPNDIARALSNLHGNHFIFRDYEIASMEALLQSLKMADAARQRATWGLIGQKARNSGQSYKWQSQDFKLFWQGKAMIRFDKPYQLFLNEAYMSLFMTNQPLLIKLVSTKDEAITHSIGKNHQKETVLTESEFVGRLTWIRAFVANEDRAIRLAARFATPEGKTEILLKMAIQRKILKRKVMR